MSDEQEMQIRKFLKRVGVESHGAIAAALAQAAGPLPVRVELRIGDNSSPAKVFDDVIGPD